MAYKFGRFLLVVGVLLVVLFMITDYGGRPWFLLFFIGAPLATLGAVLMYRFRTPPQPSKRFSIFKKNKK